MSILGFDAIGRLALGQLPPATATAAAPNVFSASAAPLRKAGLTAAVIATTVAGFIPPPQAQAALEFTQFSQPIFKKPIQQQPWLTTPAFIAPVNPPFSQFSQPRPSRVTLPDEQPSTLFEVAPPPIVSIAFSQFSQPRYPRTVLADEQPSALFEVLPPPAPPFTGFARFEEVIRARARVDLLTQFSFTPLFIPPDTHDLVFMGDQFRKKKKGKSPIDLELERKAKLRADLELAVYGPEVSYEPPVVEIPATPAAPPNVEELTRAIMAARAAHEHAQRAEIEQDDEDVIEMILRDL
jgi:hypothetical protein